MQTSWQPVYQDGLLHRAEIVKDVLEAHDFKAVMISKKDSAYQLGYFEVLVAQDQVIPAIRLINTEIHFE